MSAPDSKSNKYTPVNLTEESESQPSSHELQSRDARRENNKLIAQVLGIPVGLLVAVLTADCGANKLEQINLVMRTREKAELVSKSPCAVSSFSPRNRFEFPSQRGVEYNCERVKVVVCGPDRRTHDYACRSLTFYEIQERMREQMRKMTEKMTEFKAALEDK